MGQLSAKLTLNSTTATTDNLSLSVSDTLTFSNDVIQKRIATSDTAAVFLAAASYGKSYVFLKNLSITETEIIYIRSGATDSANVHSLGAEEFIFFSWSGAEDLVYDAATGTPVLEILLFEV
tara:strand:+ start:220 stop:585 length:366 start_codon:yes stop_codon:yes gene_type:complete